MTENITYPHTRVVKIHKKLIDLVKDWSQALTEQSSTLTITLESLLSFVWDFEWVLIHAWVILYQFI